MPHCTVSATLILLQVVLVVRVLTVVKGLILIRRRLCSTWKIPRLTTLLLPVTNLL